MIKKLIVFALCVVTFGAELYCSQEAQYSAEDVQSLHEAAKRGDLGVCQQLINKGIPVDVRDVHQQTPLFRAVENNSYASVECLLNHGADAVARDCHGRTLLHSLTCLYCDSADAVAQRKNVAELLYSYGVPLNAADDRGRTKLHEVAEYDDTEFVHYLLERNANISLTDYRGCSALCAAISNFLERKSHQCLRLLLRAGARPHVCRGDSVHWVYVLEQMENNAGRKQITTRLLEKHIEKYGDLQKFAVRKLGQIYPDLVARVAFLKARAYMAALGSQAFFPEKTNMLIISYLVTADTLRELATEYRQQDRASSPENGVSMRRTAQTGVLACLWHALERLCYR